MDNFIFSINATLPIFLIMLIGYFLKRKKMVNESFVEVSNNLNFNLALPLLLFQDLASTKIKEGFSLKLFIFCIVVTTISFWGIWFVTKCILKNQSMVGAFVQASFRSSAAILGIAFIQNMYGSLGAAPVMIISAVPLYNIYSVIVLSYESADESNRTTKNAVINICKNPIILAILVGLTASTLGLYDIIPVILTKTIGSIAKLATPLALLTIGAGFEGRKAITKIKPTIIAGFIKLILLPLLFVPVAIWLGFRGQEMIAILIMLGSPTTVSCYIMALNMKNDGVLTSSIIVLTTLFSSLTLTGWIFILRSFGMVY